MCWFYLVEISTKYFPRSRHNISNNEDIIRKLHRSLQQTQRRDDIGLVSNQAAI